MMAAIDKQLQGTSLKLLLEGFCITEYLPEIEVSGLAIDSRYVQPGYAFIAMEGQFNHGLAYAEAAIERGASVILCDADYDQYCQQILARLVTRAICVPVKNLRRKMGDIAARIYQHNQAVMPIIGVTGTNGKTSVTHFIAQAMSSATQTSAVIGTLGNGAINNLSESTHTTPDVVSVHQMLSDYEQRGMNSVAMEVSSHGLDQERVAGLCFDVAVLTNISRDHLDYHGDMESYRQAKRKLFVNEKAKSLVLNADDEFGMQLYAEFSGERTSWLYSVKKERVKGSENYAYAENVVLESSGISFMLHTSQGSSLVSLGLLGEFNVHNVLACTCVLLQTGMNFNHVVKRLENISTVRGRMELIKYAESPAIVIDYAHTPDALEQALKSVRKHHDGRLICVFGCGGERDSGKRPMMAEVAESLADLVILTNDNPRGEDPDHILDEIKKGIKNPVNLIVEKNRGKAICQAIEMATRDDMVLIAGKGHETYQIVGNETIYFSDQDQARSCLGVCE